MKRFKALNISGALLDDIQFATYMEKIASEHNLKKFSDKNTFPIYKLKEDYNFILETYNLLNKHIKMGIKIHSAGEWILDNFYIIEENVKMIEKEIKLKDYKNLQAIATGKYEGFARIYVLAAEIVAFTDCNVNNENVKKALIAYQNKKVLSIEEIEKIPLFLKIVLINKIRDICEKIYSSQIQKYKVESIINRIIEKKELEEDLNLNKKINQKINDRSKFAFIEYMSYRLKKYGKTAIDYQKVLEEEVAKLGLTVSDIIQKEHFYIANLKITIGNSIKSIKNINRINVGEFLETISITERILNLDPAEVYFKMDQETKNLYRDKIQKIAKKARVSEIYIAENILKLASRYKEEKRQTLKRKSHIGYYIIDDGINELEKIIFNKSKNMLNQEQKSRLYVGSTLALTFTVDFYFTLLLYIKTLNIGYWIISYILLFIPVSEIVIRVTNYIMLKTQKPKLVPKINYENEIPDELSTFIVIPCILKNKEKVIELCRKLEVYYLANKYENLYFAILGDCSQSNKLKEDFDEEVIKTGLEEIRKLNEKYRKNDFNRFHFLYRKRVWNDSESAFIGWERKRGLLVTFNLYIKNKIKNNFLINTIENQKDSIPNIKYIITLDSDTNLVLNTAPKLIGAMDHILNRPIIQDKKVIFGYGIMQPRIGLEMGASKINKFIEIYSVPGGIDFYSNAMSDLYQDNFNEGIFTGKGIYDVDVYNEVLEKEIPENTVLSHDLLEGNFLRCALLSDVVLLDGFPKKYIPYILRNHRWIRGDWQIIKWIKSKRLNTISKFKIFDNLRRSTVNIFAIISFIIGLIVKRYNLVLGLTVSSLSIVSVLIAYILDIIDYIVFKESRQENAINASKKFSKDFNTVTLSLIKAILSLALLPYEAYKNLDAILRSIYRMRKKKRLLQWTTSEDSEKNSKTGIVSYYKEMFINVIFGMFLVVYPNILINILGVFWIIAPYIMYKFSVERKIHEPLNNEEKKLLLEIGKRTWDFFADSVNEENHYLIPDNYQEERLNKTVDRTSSTNIGLEIISIISSFDLGYIDKEKCLEYLRNVFSTIKVLPKWNGHLYNWYNIKTLDPLKPRYISTVDSGNFIGYLYVAKQFLIENNIKDSLLNDIDVLINNTDFSVLYNKKIKLLSIGFNIENNELTDSYYDFLASEARQASIIAIAKKDIPEKHWNILSRTLTTLGRYKGLVSWTGTAFEYLMPNIVMKRYEGSLLDESSKFALFSQINYSKKFSVPWGISESAYNLKDLNYNYQYKAFGVPWLGLKRGLEEDLVISPYSTFLGLEDTKKEGITNIKKLIDEGAYGRYGFYEAIDYTPKRLSKNQKRAVVKTYMAHHQGLILNSINNYINSKILIKRFSANPEIEAIDILLQERMPKDMIITIQKKYKVSKLKIIEDANYFEREIHDNSKIHKKVNILTNDNYQVITNSIGESLSKYKNNIINEYKRTNERWQGINIYIKNLKSKKIIDFYTNSKAIYYPDKNKFVKTDNNLKLELKTTIDPNNSTEIRELEITNNGNNEELIEIIEDFVPVLSEANQEYSHPAFNKLFLNIEEKNGNLIVGRRDRKLKNNLYLATTLYTENEQIGDFEYEIDRQRYLGRENFRIPKLISDNENFSTEVSYKTDYIVAMKRSVKIGHNQKVNIALIISVGENKESVIENLTKLKSNKEIEKIFDISKARAEEELRYLQIRGKNAVEYYELLDYILDNNFAMKKNINFNKTFQRTSLWKFGISGDLPIILVKPNKLEDMYILEEIIDAYLFYRSKKIYIDLIILNEEISNDEYVKNSIEEIVLNKQIGHLKNISTGIFIFEKNKLSVEEIETFNFKAKIVIKNSDTLKRFLNSIKPEKEEREFIVNEFRNQEPIEELVKLEEYENTYGDFSEDGKEYSMIITPKSKLPTVWSNVLANKFFGTLVTDNMGGFTWNKNSRLNRLTAWNNDPILNFPSEIIYIKDIYSDKIWTLNNSINAFASEYKVTYGFGYARYLSDENQVNQETIIFVPNNENFKITKVKLRNSSDQRKVLKILLYVKDVLGEDEIFTTGNINLMKYNNMILAKNSIEQEGFENKIMFITSNLKIKSFTGEKDNFFGEGDFICPDAIYKENLNNKSGLGKNNCIAIEFEIEIQAYEEKQFFIAIGQESNINDIEEVFKEYDINRIENELINTRKNWDNILGTLKVKIPDKDLEKLLNGWIIYQTISSRLYAKSSYYQSGGAYGFRDQLQDCLALKYLDSEILKSQIINCARHQFLEGDVLHWWHEETKRGIRTKFSDDLLWLVYGTIEYIEFTGDYSILDEKIEYLKGDLLDKNQDERYDIYYQTEYKGSLYEHCIKAIERGLNFGKNGIPKIGTGDWNDGFSNLGRKGERRKCLARILLV
ncbi:MAG: GH36-type glycosyl hydrolase domain-containing protein [Candidatus Scatovivens sp.]